MEKINAGCGISNILVLGTASENSIVEFKIAIGVKYTLMEGKLGEPPN